MEHSDKDVQNAVRELRGRLGLNQVQFARRISRAINTVSRYESQIAPKGESLIPYAALAIRSNFADLAQVFRTAIIDDFGTDLEFVLGWQPAKGELATVSEDEALMDAFRAFITAKDLHPIEEIARKSLKETLAYYHPQGLNKKTKRPA